MKWLLIAGGVVVGVIVLAVVVVVVIGMMIEREHTATVSVLVKAPAERVWGLIAGEDVSWRAGVTSSSIERVDGKEVVTETDSWGKAIRYETVERVEGRLLKRRIVNEDLPYGGTWTWEVTPEGDGCRVRITEDGFIRNPVFRFVAKYVMGYDGTMRAYLKGMCGELGEEFVEG
jgi:hypothetical protein